MQPSFEIEEAKPAAPDYTLQPVHGIVLGAFLGSMIAGGFLIALNYWRMGKASPAFWTLAISLVGGVGLFVVAMQIPDNVPNAALYLPQLLGIFAIANGLQGEAIREHERLGGKVASVWPSVGISLLCLPIIVGLVFGVAFLMEPSYGTLVEFGNDEILYAGDATEEDARQLGVALQTIDFFDGSGATVRLESQSGKDTVSFVLVDNAWEDPEVAGYFRTLGKTLITFGLSDPLTVQLCDDYLEVKKTLVVQRDEDENA